LQTVERTGRCEAAVDAGKQAIDNVFAQLVWWRAAPATKTPSTPTCSPPAASGKPWDGVAIVRFIDEKEKKALDKARK